jgi:succinoglycan biosynthesis transport protein ExoP
VDLAFVLVTLRRAWWLLLLTATLGVTGAAIVNATSPVQYTATVQQFVSMTGQVDTSGTNGALSGSQFTLQRVKSYTQIATSSQVLQPVIDQLRLPTTVGRLADRVQASNPLDTVLITLSVTDVDPRRAADTANAISVQLGKVVQDIEAPAGGGVSPVKVTVTEQATVPTAPVSPKVKLNLALGLLVGLGLGAGGALLRAQLDTRITHVSDVEGITGRAPLGVVPFDGDAKAHPLISSDQTSPRAEAFRALRTNLRFADVDNPPRVLVVTSALPGEGKSTATCNIALTLALNGSRVVLVEADLRKPRAASYLGLDSAVGLTNVLAGQYGLDDVLVGHQGGRLTVLPAGPVPPNPSELLGSQQLSTTIRTLAAAFDYVIIDAAPLLPVTDAAVLSSAADGALVVVRHSRTTRDELQRALQALEAANARVLGSVVNFAPHRRRGRGSYGYGYRGYGGYGSKPGGDQRSAPPAAATASAPVPVISQPPSASATRTPAPQPPSDWEPRRTSGQAPRPEPGLTLLPFDPTVTTTVTPGQSRPPTPDGNNSGNGNGKTGTGEVDPFTSPYTGSMKSSPYTHSSNGPGTADGHHGAPNGRPVLSPDAPPPPPAGRRVIELPGESTKVPDPKAQERNGRYRHQE